MKFYSEEYLLYSAIPGTLLFTRRGVQCDRWAHTSLQLSRLQVTMPWGRAGTVSAQM